MAEMTVSDLPVFTASLQPPVLTAQQAAGNHSCRWTQTPLGFLPFTLPSYPRSMQSQNTTLGRAIMLQMSV